MDEAWVESNKEVSVHIPNLQEGLLLGLGATQLPARKALDLGSGFGMYTIPLARQTAYVEAYDSNPDRVEDLCQLLEKQRLSAIVKCANILHLKFAPRTLSAACIGMNIYIPKEQVRQLHQQVWEALLPGGILHSTFATHEDEAEITDFVTKSCLQDPGEPGSYIHRCGSFLDPPCMHIRRGIIGGSFWPPRDAKNLIIELGPCELVHTKTFTWQQDNGTEKPLHRSFCTVTVIKR